MSAKRSYRQTIRMKDSDGVEVTLLLTQVAEDRVDVSIWKHPEVKDVAIVHTLLRCCALLTNNPDLQDYLGPAQATAFDECIRAGLPIALEGQVTPSDDLPF